MANRDRFLNSALAGLLLTPIPLVARAEIYLTEDQAAKVLFPGVNLTPDWVDLSAQDLKLIAMATGETPTSARVRQWKGPNGETLIVDEVLGKHQFITYAVGIGPDGKVIGVEILDYRETYGYQIHDKSWRQSFVGKSAKDPLTLDKDIPNISGATLSSKHVTEGVRRILLTHEYLQTKN